MVKKIMKLKLNYHVDLRIKNNKYSEIKEVLKNASFFI